MLLCSWGFPGKNTRMGRQFLLQGIFLDQGSNPQLLHGQVDSIPLSPRETHSSLCFHPKGEWPSPGTSLASLEVSRALCWVQKPRPCLPLVFPPLHREAEAAAFFFFSPRAELSPPTWQAGEALKGPWWVAGGINSFFPLSFPHFSLILVAFSPMVRSKGWFSFWVYD